MVCAPALWDPLAVATPATPTRSPAPTLRKGRDRHLFGVCSGLAEAGHIDPWLVRTGFILLATVGGLGVPAYVVLAIALPEADAPPDAPMRWDVVKADVRQPIGVALVTAGVLMLAGNLGAPIPFGLAWGLAIGLGFTAWGYFRATAERDEGSGRRVELLPGRETAVRYALGAVLVGAGVVTLVAAGSGWEVLRQVLLGALVTVGGLGLILYPWVRGLLTELGEERRERIRSEERADMAAHLHDSVLQTLALIQNRAGASSEVGRIARAQERELREWLYANAAESAREERDLGAELREVAATLEVDHAVHFDIVTVGEAVRNAPECTTTVFTRFGLIGAVDPVCGASIEVTSLCAAWASSTVLNGASAGAAALTGSTFGSALATGMSCAPSAGAPRRAEALSKFCAIRLSTRASRARAVRPPNTTATT